MQYEIDYMPVGNGSKGGDAIALRYGDFSERSKYKVIVIDGGTKDSGKKLVEHIKTFYATEHVDLVIASHLHSDHISGLTEVFENLTVGEFALHCPWDHTQAIKKMTMAEATADGIVTKLEKSLVGLTSLVELAEEKGIQIIQPFQGERLLDEILVLSPSKEYYQSLMVNFGCMPAEPKKEHLLEKFTTFAKDALTWIAEELHIETLSDEYEDTDPENNSSFILFLEIDGHRMLFTGDAGKDAITKSLDYADSIGLNLSNINFFDVPHHGSKKNLGPSILDKLRPQQSFISCPPEGDPKHPSRKVINAILRREGKVHTNKHGMTICHRSSDAPDRGWTNAKEEEFFNQVEE